MNILGLFGTHGVGKTTICKELERRGWRTNTQSVPRAAQLYLGWDTLSIVEKSEENLWAMQDTVLSLLVQRDAKINESNVLTFVDRTPVDLAGYVTLWAHRRNWNIDKDRYIAYIEACRVQCAHYRHQFYVPMRSEIPFVAEPNRGDLAGREINQEAMCEFVNKQAISHVKVHTLKVTDRADEIEIHVGPKNVGTRITDSPTLKSKEVRDLLDDEGENRAVRSFLSLYGGTNGGAIDTQRMRYQLEMSGFEGAWPEWANEDQTLTKAGAQIWLRHLFSLEGTKI